jgi:hypothetical protein
MLIKSKITFLLIIAFITVLLLVLIFPSNQQVSSQSPGGVLPPQGQLETVKILNPMPFQNVDLKKELVISGQSSDTIAKDCSVYIIVNGVKPYQSAVASGTGGATDFSQWKFVLHEQYTHLNEGNNKITAKLLCKIAPTQWYSVVVKGVPNSNVSETSPVESTQQSNVSETSPVESTQQSNVSETSPVESTQQSNVSETSPVESTQPSNVSETSPVESTQQSNVSETSPVESTQPSNVSETSPVESTQPSNVSETSPVESTQPSKLLVTISPLKNPVARGDTQNATITVTDSNRRGVANAQIDGKLIYPGKNFEKEFKGSTDLEGKFVYSWIVGKKGDVGPLVVEVEASSQGYPPTSANNSFEIVKSGESSKIENPFQSNFQRP